MTDNERYCNAAKRSIIEHLNKLRQYQCLKFTGDKVIRTLIFKHVPSYGITDDELLVVSDNVIRFLQQNPDDSNSYDPNHFYLRYIDAMIELIDRALVNIVGAANFIDEYALTEEITCEEKTVDTNQPFITITDVLDSIDILEELGLSEEETNALRNSIIIGLKSISTDSLHPIMM